MKNQQGFTLIELAIVLVIVTILVGGLAMPLSAQIQARRIAETRNTLAEAREALLGYAMTHPATSLATNRYLPALIVTETESRIEFLMPSAQLITVGCLGSI